VRISLKSNSPQGVKGRAGALKLEERTTGELMLCEDACGGKRAREYMHEDSETEE